MSGPRRADPRWSRRWAKSAPRWAGSRGLGGMMADTGHGAADEPPLDRTNSESVVEKTCKYLSALALMVMLVVVGIDVVTRWGFNFSYEVSDEVAAYMLVAIAFLSLPVSHINGAFHRVEFVQARLSMRWKLISS